MSAVIEARTELDEGNLSNNDLNNFKTPCALIARKQKKRLSVILNYLLGGWFINFIFIYV